MVKNFMKNINSSSNIFSEVWRKHLTLNKNTECQNIYFLYLGAFLVSRYIKSSPKKEKKKLSTNAFKLSLNMVLWCSKRIQSNTKHIQTEILLE